MYVLPNQSVLKEWEPVCSLHGRNFYRVSLLIHIYVMGRAAYS